MDFWHSIDNCLIGEGDQAIATLNCVPGLINRLVQMALLFGGAVAVFFVIWGGLKIIRSGGDPKQMEGAKGTITWAIVGLIIVFLANFLISVIATITGVECIKTLGFNQCQ